MHVNKVVGLLQGPCRDNSLERQEGVWEMKTAARAEEYEYVSILKA
jgi:hypothetical protein